MKKTIIATLIAFLILPQVQAKTPAQASTPHIIKVIHPQHEVVAYFDSEGKPSSTAVQDGYYRVNLGKTAQGLTVLQDFYANGTKQTNPFILTAGGDAQEFTDTQIDGRLITWYPNGKKASEGFYTKGIANGLYQSWDDTGVLLSKGIMSNGTAEGSWQEVLVAAAEVSRGTYQNGLRTGIWTAQNQSWKTKTQTPYYLGLKHGVNKAYDEKGRLDGSIPYVADKPEGLAVAYRGKVNNSAQDKQMFVNGLQHGNSSTYGHGKKISQVHYSAGEFDGESVEYDAQGEPISVVHYKNSQPHGEWKLGGQMLNYAYGQLDGIQTERYPNGQIASEKYFIKGVPDGTWREWDQTGELTKERTYKNGMLDGKWLEYHAHKNLWVNGQYAAGKTIGVWTWLNKASEKRLEVRFNDNHIEVARTEWDEQGNVLDKPTNTSQRFNAEGRAALIIHFMTDGLKVISDPLDPNGNSMLVAQHGNGVLALKTVFKQWKLNGGFQRWYDNGQLEVQGEFIDNQRAGHWQIWHDNGQLESEGDYLNGAKNGTWKRWDEHGQAAGEESYQNGKKNGPWINRYAGNGYTEKGAFLDDEKHGVWELTKEGKTKTLTTYAYGERSGLAMDTHDNGQTEIELHYAAAPIIPKSDPAPVDINPLDSDVEAMNYEELNNFHIGSRDPHEDFYEKERYQYSSRFDGEFKQWLLDGTLEVQGQYKNAVKDGLWEQWYDKGHKQSESHYMNGSADGVWQDWYYSQQLRNSMNFKDGKLDGLRTLYYPDGSKWMEWQYQNDVELSRREWDIHGKELAYSKP